MGLQYTIYLGRNEELISDSALLSPFAYKLFGGFILAENDRESWKHMRNG